MKAKLASAIIGGVVLLLCNGSASHAQQATMSMGAGLSQGVPFDPYSYNGGAFYLTIRVYPGNDGYHADVDHQLLSKYPGNSNNGNYVSLGTQTPGYTNGYYWTGWTVSIYQGTSDVYFEGKASPWTIQFVNPQVGYQSFHYDLIKQIGPFYGYSQSQGYTTF